MNIRISAILFGACLAAFPSFSNAQGFGVKVDSSDALPNQIVCLPVYTQGFSEMISYQYSLTWDPQVLQFDHVQQLNLPGQMISDFNLVSPGRLLTLWAHPNGLGHTLPNGSVAYEICFVAVAIVGNSTDITAGGEGFPPGSGSAEAYNETPQNIWTPALLTPGYVEIVTQAGTSGTSDALQNAETSFQLSPNPTQAATQVAFESDVAGTANLLVTDASGRRVLEQKIAVKTGENKVEIPAKTLTVKGMYQVSLQIGQRVSTQMLSVQ